MRACIQRVTRAEVRVDGAVVGKIERGLLVLLGVAADDGPPDAKYLVDKVVGLRVFEDEAGKMNRSIVEAGGQLLVVSQFTLYGDVRKGRRPSFVAAAPPELADSLYEQFVRLAGESVHVQTGKFRADMQVELVNDGPVTILLDSTKLF